MITLQKEHEKQLRFTESQMKAVEKVKFCNNGVARLDACRKSFGFAA